MPLDEDGTCERSSRNRSLFFIVSALKPPALENNAGMDHSRTFMGDPRSCVTLHSERVSIDRRPASAGASVDNADFTDRTIEVAETDEEGGGQQDRASEGGDRRPQGIKADSRRRQPKRASSSSSSSWLPKCRSDAITPQAVRRFECPKLAALLLYGDSKKINVLTPLFLRFFTNTYIVMP